MNLIIVSCISVLAVLIIVWPVVEKLKARSLLLMAVVVFSNIFTYNLYQEEEGGKAISLGSALPKNLTPYRMHIVDFRDNKAGVFIFAEIPEMQKGIRLYQIPAKFFDADLAPGFYTVYKIGYDVRINGINR